MAFQGFGKQSGPSAGASPRPDTSFGYFPSNPPPPLNSYSSGPETQVRSPPFPMEGFRPVPGLANSFPVVQRPAGSIPNWGNGKNSTPSPPFPAFNNSTPRYSVRNVQVQDMKRIRPPPLLSRDEDRGRNARTIIVRHPANQRAPSPPSGFQNLRHLDDLGSFSDVQRHSVNQRAPSPPSGFQNGRHLDDLGSFSGVQRNSFNQRAPSPPSGFQNGRHLDDLGSFSDAQSQRLSVSQRAPSPPSGFQNVRHFDDLGSSSDAQRHSITQRPQSPPPGFLNSRPFDNLGSFNGVQRNSVGHRAKSPPSSIQSGSFSDVQRNSSPSKIWPTQYKSPTNFTNPLIQQGLPSVSNNMGTYNNSRNFPSNQEDKFMPNRTRSPPPSYADIASPEDSTFAGDNSKRSSLSPPRTNIRSNADTPDKRNHRGSPTPTKPTNHVVQKRSRSPSFVSSDQGLEGDSSAQDETERDLQAKAKRLARFKEELSQPEPSNIVNQKHPANRPAAEMQSEPSDMDGDFRDSADYEVQEPSNIIIGLCPDMCPETERGERERKGDLDQYERVGGDRNQTDISLAVKKYTRTAEREADLIRPMHILQMTLDYLLNLLDQPYDQKFLGLYNFLWDRMRAIRMDLRMQHIFNQGAIKMLEQMIRLHIIAMHELCEYTKGEGFSEGFDAHLNIEQMNKTSVELFQLYDDHRKKGIDIPTEKEFRGYYALLKLDKHPGYKVEPAELSLDLAKMTPEIRQTSEIVFARDVARACRTGNYIAFFRLARKASYLQACLMHAHFAKLRSQALAALHSGLQNSQGIPISQISKWLVMEDEDIENLMDHHGFVIKEFEEPYMVKEGNFLGGENDYPLQCSKLVHSKKSTRIFKDVFSPSLMENFSSQNVKELKPRVISRRSPKRVHFSEFKRSPVLIDQKMPDFQAVSSPKKIMQFTPLFKPPVTSVIPDEVMVEVKKNSGEKPRLDIITQNPFQRNLSFDVKSTPKQVSPKRVQLQQQILPPLQLDDTADIPVDQPLFTEYFEKDPSFESPKEIETETEAETEMEEISANFYDKEVAEAKLKLMLRTWKRRCIRRREIRERKQLEADAALSKLSLGPPIWNDKHLEITSEKFNINQVVRDRYGEQKKSWSTVNVSDVVATKLSDRNPNSRCLCWKILLISQLEGNKEEQISHLAAGSWLCSKLMPAKDNDEGNLVISAPDLSIWKKWVRNESDDDTCCLSVIKDTNPSSMNDDSVLGASAVVFLVYNSIPWNLQKTLLNRLLDTIPSGSRLPLLILIGSQMDGPDSSPIANELGLHEVDKSRISEYSIISLIEENSFFSDTQLREGLKWLSSESPLQPNLHCIKPYDLVRSHLNPKLEAFDRYNGYEVNPNHCISTLNEALDSSIEDIMTSANSNPAYWPCPEINLLADYSYEQNAVEMNLPSAGWNLPARIELLTRAIRQCKLPMFSDDISWLYRGSESGTDTEAQRILLEDSLVRYLSETSHLMGVSLAKKEANVMLQNSARLELKDSTYYIVPKWAMIFRRIFNWRLMSMNTDALSNAYILESRQSISSQSIIAFESTDSYLIPPTLDEMVEVGRSPFNHDTSIKAHRPPSSEPKNDVINYVEDEMDFGDIFTERASNKRLELGLAASGRKEADRLSKLVEQCNIVQNLNAEKLSIYF